jgi:hypothetical protein
VLGRLRDGKLVLDLRTVAPEQESDLVEAVRRAFLGQDDAQNSGET